MKKYCDNCHKECEIIEKDSFQSFNVKGCFPVSATIHLLICSECGEEVYDEKNEIANEDAVFSSYYRITGKHIGKY